MFKKMGMMFLIITMIVVFSISSFAQTKGTIGIAGWGQNNPFFVLLHNSAKAVLEAAGYKVIISDGETKVDKQTNDIDNFIAMGVKAMLLTPVDSFALASAVNRVADAGIPIISCDMTVYNAKLNATVESDNYNAGYIVGKWMIDYYKNMESTTGAKGPFQVVCGLWSQANSCRDRQEGFEAAIAKGPTGLIEIIKKQEAADVSIEGGYEIGQNFLTAYKDLDAMFFGCNDNVALGALKAVQEAGRDDVVVTGVDGQVEAVNAINAGTAFKCTGAQHPQVIGHVAALNLLDLLDGKKIPTYIKIACSAIYLPFQPFGIDPAEFVASGNAISRTVDVTFPITEPVK